MKTEQMEHVNNETINFNRQIQNELSAYSISINFIGEFDPGSGRTLAACLIHASRAELIGSLLLINLAADG
ncbi:hypothetical protein HMSSN139_66680 [Paenibacillus sp. HMSSN-139]|nr:hypothetical protein HMSSN139_66680 [Paenibacillus sp. HMSSN-139]